MDCLFVVIIVIYIFEFVNDNHLEILHRLKQKYCDKSFEELWHQKATSVEYQLPAKMSGLFEVFPLLYDS